MFQRFGIGARLLLAFCGISLFAVLAGVAALYSFIEVGKVLSRISLIEAPEAIHSLELSRQAERMVSTASEMQTITTLGKHERIQGKCLLDFSDGLVETSSAQHQPSIGAMRECIAWIQRQNPLEASLGGVPIPLEP